MPASAIAGLGVCTAILVLASYARAGVRGVRRAALAGLRLLAVAGLVLVLLRPMKAEPVERPGERPLFTVLVDMSASMKTRDVGDRTRQAAVREALTQGQRSFLRELSERYDLRFATFSKLTEPTTLEALIGAGEPTGIVTDLSTALLDATHAPPGRRIAGVLLVSDGRDNSGRDVAEAAQYLKRENVPVWTVPIGSETQAKDLFATARLKQKFLTVDQPGTLTALVSHSGLANQYAKVALFREEEPVGTQQVLLDARGAVVDFEINEPHKGVFRYRVEVDPLPGESDTANNKRSVFVRAVDEKTRVLFVEAQPYWDSKFLLRALQSDPHIEVTSVFQMNPDKVLTIAERTTADPLLKAAVTQGVSLPRTREELFRFDCIVFGRNADTVFASEQLALVRDFVVHRGGSVVFSRGRAYGFDSEALMALEPIVWDREFVRGARFELTPEGRTSPLFSFGKEVPSDVVVRELPEMVSVTKVSREKSLSVILARSVDDTGDKEMATIAYQRYGKGKVMTIGATGLWRWALMPPNLAAYDDVYARFWGQMIRWLVAESDFLPGQEVSFQTDEYAYNLGDTARFTVRTKFMDEKEFQPLAVVTTPSGKTITLQLEPEAGIAGLYSSRYLPEEEGEYLAVMRDAARPTDITAPAAVEAVRFTAYADSVENRFVAADTALMKQIASITGGESLNLDRLASLPSNVAEFEQRSTPKSEPTDAWDTLMVFAIITGFLAAEWFARRRTGLV